MDGAHRVSDTDRAAVRRLLRAHHRAGRLTAQELSQRTATAASAVTGDELAALFVDLPAGVSPVHRGLHDRAWRAHAVVFAVGAGGTVGLWQLTRDPTPPPADYGADYWWPLWFALVWAVVLVAHYLWATGLFERPEPASASARPVVVDLDVLTARERDVLRLIANGDSNQAIADRLVISERTARTHVSNILRKLGLSSRTQAALLAVRAGLADDQAGGDGDQHEAQRPSG